MTLLDLKQKIINKQAITNFIIFVCPEHTFIANQYLNEIVHNANLPTRIIYSLADIKANSISMVIDSTNFINILKVDEFNELFDNYDGYDQTIVICNTISKEVKAKVIDYVIEIPKLDDWQVYSYITAVCPGLSENEAKNIYNSCFKDIYLIDSEISKIALFPVNEQLTIYQKIINESTHINYDIFEFRKALISQDFNTLYKYMSNLTYLNLEAMSIVNLLLQAYKNILYVCFKSGINPETVGISNGQAYYIKKDYIGIPLQRVKDKIAFLADIDSRLKNGELDIDKSTLLNYILINCIL